MKYKFIDLFCGAGGFAKGFEMAGFECVGGIDNVKAAIDTHSFNFPKSKSICRDIRKIEPEEFHEIIGKGNKIDVIIGGPPCPTFSTIGHAKIQSISRMKDKDITDDPRNELFMDYLKYVKYFQPEIFVMENVPNFMTKYKGKTFERVKQIIENDLPEYEIVSPTQILNAVFYGVPQVRKRMILVACKKNLTFKYPTPTHWYDESLSTKSTNTYEKSKILNKTGLPLYIDVKTAISDLPIITDNWRIDECEYSYSNKLHPYQKLMRKNTKNTVRNNICRMSNDRAKKVFEYMNQGDIYIDLPKEIRNILPFREDIFKDRLKRLVNTNPSWTILAHIGMDGYMYIHPEELRTLSVREAARIQSFPDDFVFIGGQGQTYIQVGNAVPPLMSFAIAKNVKKALSR
ncbi:DNA cytosine methyltransferase [Aliarcobacter cryaerophilus]|uniref:Cytosine-specific methyltransferase n=1 Tax=Aliarcobacter cryaerophilus ATCC 43158 TaxID=1032070 RepID=A0AAD0TTT2_9BACT|nr:DNA cytosine methyltransferase [Aliarcobacter cryaerophilus]AYJ79219.1 type II cytosine-specific DNA methyltransferase [Aliarcobacter cryaerophilus ATCC 43158]